MRGRSILTAAFLLPVMWADGFAQGREVRGTVTRNGRALANVAVSVVPVDTAVPGSVDTVEIDQRELRFVPNIVAVGVGGSVMFRNSDPYLHNVYSPTGAQFTLGTYARGDTRLHRFETPGRYVVLCNVHPEMVAYVFVVSSPYHAITDSDGRFTVAGLPAGGYLVQVWLARGPPFEQIVSAAQVRNDRLRIEIGSDTGRPQ